MPVDLEALDTFIFSLKQASPKDKELANYPGGEAKIIIPPGADPRGYRLPEIIVHRNSRNYIPNIYEIPELGIIVGSFERNSDQYNYPLNRFVSSLGGNQVEVDTSEVSYYLRSPDYWRSPWKERGLVETEYHDEIYPRVLRAVLDNLPPEPEPIEFVDLFGGDGEFVRFLHSKMDQNMRSLTTFHIIDASAPSLWLARQTFLEIPEKVLIHDPYYLQPDQEVFRGISKPPKLVTAVGGLCGGVVLREEALGIVQNVYDEMASGGTFIVSGLSGVLLNSKDFRRIGYRVENMSVPQNVVYSHPPYQLYILRKPQPGQIF